MSINDGGPAFPVSAVPDYNKGADGMSLRDYFAGQAIMGCVVGTSNIGFNGDITRDVVRRAYSVADAMIAERDCK